MDCARQEQALQLINQMQFALDDIFMLMDNEACLVQIKNNPLLTHLLAKAMENINLVNSTLKQANQPVH